MKIRVSGGEVMLLWGGLSVKMLLPQIIIIAAAAANAEPQEATVENYMDRIPAAKRELLDKELDYMNRDVDKHLGQIAKDILGWEGKLAALLYLTETEISDIVQKESQILERFSSLACREAILNNVYYYKASTSCHKNRLQKGLEPPF